MSNRNIGNGSTKDLVNSYSELVEITGGLKQSAYEIVASNVNIIKELPTLIVQMDEREVQEEDVKRILSIAKTIGRDTDAYIDELKSIDESFKIIKDQGTRKAKIASRNYTPMLAISSRYHDITSRLTETTCKLADDFTDACIELGLSDNKGDDNDTTE